MRTKKSSNSNMRFLKGNVLFFALLLIVILLFTYYAVQEMESPGESNAKCCVAFDKSYSGGECEVFIDDSLLYKGVPHEVDSLIEMKRYANARSRVSLYTSDSRLMVVSGGDTVVTLLGGERCFHIGSRDGRVTVSPVE